MRPVPPVTTTCMCPHGRGRGINIGWRRRRSRDTFLTMAPASTRALNRVSHVSMVFQDQQEALEWYTEKLGFEVVADEQMGDREGRWLTIAPLAQAELEIVLEPLDGGLSGAQAGGREKLAGHDGSCSGPTTAARPRGSCATRVSRS
ncbi:hypothetical protein BRD56_12760 [Thermoplasmatales archaeon SW_10_69_26]|nr:MAG: hypothetical protein BRD56_12760 [Thermoplasmatales archaeon SW_10_69_26]